MDVTHPLFNQKKNLIVKASISIFIIYDETYSATEGPTDILDLIIFLIPQ